NNTISRVRNILQIMRNATNLTQQNPCSKVFRRNTGLVQNNKNDITPTDCKTSVQLFKFVSEGISLICLKILMWLYMLASLPLPIFKSSETGLDYTTHC